MNNAPETVIWDLDGTIINSFEVMDGVLRTVLPEYGIVPPTPAVLAANFHGTLEQSINGCIGGVEDETLKLIVKDFVEVQECEYEMIDRHIYGDALHLMRRYDSAGSRQILVTNREHEGRLRASPRHIIANSVLKSYIDLIVCGDDSEHRKPKPEVLDAARQNREIDPERAVVVGDQFVDAQLAHNLGARAILVARHGDIHYLDQLTDGWTERTVVVASLDEVEI